MIYVYILFFLTFFTYQVLLLYFSIVNNKDQVSEIKTFPMVSVLVAARNEEMNIESCLQALSKIDYPKDKIEFLIGDDKSEDDTAKIIENFSKENSNFKLIRILDNLGNARGKANVLAHLANAAKGDYFFITDADIEVPVTWVKALLGSFSPSDGIVSGVTIVKGKGWLATMQSFEWITGFGMVKVVSDLEIPVSAVGNNMVICRKAYEATGGYPNIPFSVTEDYELFNQTLKHGFTFKNLIYPDVLAFSKPVDSLSNLFKQRKRWMTGAFQLPIMLSLFLSLQSLFFPLIISLLILFPVWGILLWIIKMLMQQLFVAIVLKRVKWYTELLKYILLFELYVGLFASAMLIYYILPTGVNWKGRKY